MNRELLLELAKSINTEYESGIWFELNSYLEYEESKIITYDLKFEEERKCFILEIKLKECNKIDIDDFFKGLVRFIEYKDSTFYVRCVEQDSIDYFLLSTMDSEKGVFLELIFNLK